jgi:NAD(P)-dependent dehydrogenase (short-subunit alcohol dehydrogenase family)
MDLGLDGRVAVVTGASKGIGLAVVQALVAEGPPSWPAPGPARPS